MKFNIAFSRYFRLGAIISSILVILSLFQIFVRGINFGVDFKGGAEIQVKFTEEVSTEDLRQTVEEAGISSSQVVALGEASDHEFMIKVAATEENINEVSDSIAGMLERSFSQEGVEIRKTDIVGPKAGKELRTAGFLAMFWAMLAIMIYIGLRFDFKYAPGVVFAVIHDVIIVIGIFSLMGREFSLQIVGALLAVIGYSVNDTVVIYDRVREHELKLSSGQPMDKIINRSLNETLTRTILTSSTTLFVALSLMIWGGGVIQDFFFAVTLGLIFGTSSSLFVASPITIWIDGVMAKKAKKNEAALTRSS